MVKVDKMTEENQTLEETLPEKEMVIADLDTLKVIAEPLRLQILQVTVEAARTVKQIAAMVHTPVSKLYYHMNMLEEHGLLRVAGTRVVSGIIEKQYRSSALRLRFDRNLMSTTGAEHAAMLDLVLSTTLDTTRSDILN